MIRVSGLISMAFIKDMRRNDNQEGALKRSLLRMVR